MRVGKEIIKQGSVVPEQDKRTYRLRIVKVIEQYYLIHSGKMYQGERVNRAAVEAENQVSLKLTLVYAAQANLSFDNMTKKVEFKGEMGAPRAAPVEIRKMNQHRL